MSLENETNHAPADESQLWDLMRPEKDEDSFEQRRWAFLERLARGILYRYPSVLAVPIVALGTWCAMI